MAAAMSPALAGDGASAFVALLVLLAMMLFAVIRVPEEDARRSWPR